jgi:hypothetical protein
VLIAAAAAALFHIAPLWRAASETPAGWEFTGNLTISPDYMQYRVWARQAAEAGPLLADRFTAEPNRPHIFVPFYWFVGKTARWLGTTPELVYAYAGVPLAFGLVLLLWAAVRRFLPDERQAWWVFLATLAGGGLGAHLKIAAELPVLGAWYPVDRLITEPLLTYPAFEDYRSHYVVKTLLDTHFLLIWIVALGAVVAFIDALQRPSAFRSAAAGALFAAATALHVYEGVTLVVIAAAVVACVWPLRADRRAVLGVLGVVTVAALVPLGAIYALFARSGLPLPSWRAVPILPLTLLLAYPVSWGLVAWGGRDLWQRGRFGDRVLLGWASGCTVLTLSAPFYPYPDRGTMTMQVPLMVLAGIIYFARWERLTPRAALVAVFLLGATPAWLVARTWRNTGFRPDRSFAFISADHRRIIDTLVTRASGDDILAADPGDLLWLAPEYPGRLFAGHFFLTVDYDRKIAEWRAFLADTLVDRRLAFLRRTGTRFFFVAEREGPEGFARVPRVTALARSEPGWLFEYRPGPDVTP